MKVKETNKYSSKLYKPKKPFYKMTIDELSSHILICKSLDRMSYSKIKRIETFSPEKLEKKIQKYLEKQKQKKLRKNKTRKKNNLIKDDENSNNKNTNNKTVNPSSINVSKHNFRKSKKISDLGKMIKRTIKKKVLKLKKNKTIKSLEID